MGFICGISCLRFADCVVLGVRELLVVALLLLVWFWLLCLVVGFVWCGGFVFCVCSWAAGSCFELVGCFVLIVLF